MQLPFNNPINDDHYAHWRNNKLKQCDAIYGGDLNKLFLNIKDARSLTAQEKSAILSQTQKNSLCLYKINDLSTDTKENVHQIAKQIGLKYLDNNLCADPDKLTSITQTEHKGQHEYIPYSNKRLSWHTDGYYNTKDNQINALLLHCAQPAAEGGESLIMDHEIAYLLMRDESPEYIKGLMQPDAMTIPANILNGKIIREAQTGPVFSVNSQGGLHMRYSARKRNIEWKQSSPILEAVAFLEELLNSESQYLIKYTLQAGEGLICRNVLHRRTSFVDSDNSAKKRLLYRGRYFDHIDTINNESL